MSLRGRLRWAGILSIAALLMGASGCGHKRRVVYAPPPPPPSGYTPLPSEKVSPRHEGDIVSADSRADLEFVQRHRPIWTQTGIASWYGPPYDRHRGANGQIYDKDMLSAAHRDLPMDSLLQVTNVSTGASSVMRVTDRGPFVPGRVLDLSEAAAKAIGVWRPGTAKVRIDVYAAPKPIATGGRWCVQIGAFHSEGKARKLEHKLQQKYESASVIEFKGPTGHWVRIRPEGGNRAQAERIERSLRPEEGAAYLTRLD